MVLPALSLQDVEDMSIKEIDQRITFLIKTKQEKQKVDLKNFITILHLAISTGSCPTKNNNRIFYRSLDEIFNDKKQTSDDSEESLEEIMNIVNRK